MTIKGDVNRKWTSDPRYREGFDRIFRAGDKIVGGKLIENDSAQVAVDEANRRIAEMCIDELKSFVFCRMVDEILKERGQI
jgi:hypothetical protein